MLLGIYHNHELYTSTHSLFKSVFLFLDADLTLSVLSTAFTANGGRRKPHSIPRTCLDSCLQTTSKEQSLASLTVSWQEHAGRNGFCQVVPFPTKHMLGGPYRPHNIQKSGSLSRLGVIKYTSRYTQQPPPQFLAHIQNKQEWKQHFHKRVSGFVSFICGSGWKRVTFIEE